MVKKRNNMKKKFARVAQYWQKMMESTQRKMTRGAQNISKIISRARNENWRRSDRKEKK